MPPGHARRIILWRPKYSTSSDAAGVDVTDLKSAPKEYFQDGPYAATRDQRPAARSISAGVPSLQLICLTKARELLELREDRREVLADIMPAWRDHSVHYESAVKSRPVQELLPGVDADPSSITPLKRVDPLTWALVIQLIRDLPSRFRCYEIALSDVHLPLFQHVPDSTQFCIITILNLAGCSHLTDDTISNLKDLHGLIALNASHCMGLSTAAITRLRNTLVRDQDAEQGTTRRGPWRLRILWLRGCRSLNSNVFMELDKFPLLTVVDLTDTSCYNRGNTSFRSAAVAQSNLYHPAHLLDATHTLLSTKGVLPSRNVFSLYVDQLHPDVESVKRPHRPTVKEEDGFVVLSKNAMRHGRLAPESVEKKAKHDDRSSLLRRAHYEGYDDWDLVSKYVSNPDERFDTWMDESSESSGESESETIPDDDSRGGVGNFYQTSLPQSEVEAIFLRKMNTFAPPKTTSNLNHHLNPLMLFRKPPPHTTLSMPTPANATARTPVHHSEFEVATAPVNRSLPHVQAALQSLGKLNKQLTRKQVSGVVRPADGFVIASGAESSKMPRNPFLAKSRRPMPDFGTPSTAPSSPRVQPSDLSTHGHSLVQEKRISRSNSTRMVDNTVVPTLTPPSPDIGSRPLRGISTLAVPPPPPPTKKRPRTSSKSAPAKKAKPTTLDPALAAASPTVKGAGLRPMTSTSLRQKMAEQQKRTEEDRDQMLSAEKKERRKSTGSVKAPSSFLKPRERTSTAGGGLDSWLKRS
ncbi:unnamed protein product [Peniophora sp. CBMAI 1063]|nr:unnamed protein product [Peniophora sp. CBMAI 1063]